MQRALASRLLPASRAVPAARAAALQQGAWWHGPAGVAPQREAAAAIVAPRLHMQQPWQQRGGMATWDGEPLSRCSHPCCYGAGGVPAWHGAHNCLGCLVVSGTSQMPGELVLAAPLLVANSPLWVCSYA